MLFQKAELTKLPCLPATKGGKTDFQWPSEEEMQKMFKGQAIKLQKIEIWHGDQNFMGGVRITLSNGEQSPYFQANCP